MIADSLPAGARPDQAVDGTIEIERLSAVLHVGRPAAAQPATQVSLFKLVDGGNAAVRVPVRLGRASVTTIEVLEGLAEGDEVILSDMSRGTTSIACASNEPQTRTLQEMTMTSNHTPLIRLQGIGKVYTTEEVETHALVDMDLEIAEGEYMAIAGPSGCGKTTLLSILGLLDSPTNGDVSARGPRRWRTSRRPSARASGTGGSDSSSRPST